LPALAATSQDSTAAITHNVVLRRASKAVRNVTRVPRRFENLVITF